MNQILELLLQEHGRIRSMLSCFQSELDQFEKAEKPNYEILEGSISYCQEYLDQWHHPREDALLEILEHRDPDKAKSNKDLLGQHAALAASTMELAKIFRDIVERNAVRLREDLVHRGRALALAYDQHLEWEETNFFPVIDAVLLPEDWQKMTDESNNPVDPLAANPVDHRYRALFSAIAEA